MYALSCRPSVARYIRRTVPFRSKSTSPSNAGKKPVPNTRIASSWGDIVIPTREELLLTKSQTKSDTYKPDLSYLQSDESGLASRLPRSTVRPESNSIQFNVEASSTMETLTDVESAEEKHRRLETFTAKRRAERQIREEEAEKVLRIARAARETAQRDRAAVKAAAEAARVASVERAAKLTSIRAAERMRREATMSSRERRNVSLTDSDVVLLQRTSLPQRQQRSPRPRPAVSRDRGGKRLSRPSQPKFVVHTKPSQDADLAHSKDDLTWEIIEDGGDETEAPEFTSPDVPLTNLDILFSSSFEHRMAHVTRDTALSFNQKQGQTLREVYGGKYRRFAPRNFVTPPLKLGPVQHARLVLAQRSDVSIGARDNALAIIASAAGDNAVVKKVQTVVN